MERLLGMKLSDVAGSSFLADPPERNADYKKKGNGIDKRAMRLHRRSIDQRKMRDATFQKQRGLDAMSPLKEVQNVIEKKAEKQEKTVNNKPAKAEPKSTKTDDMKDRLKKWKEEKELKKKLDRQKRAKPMFKVHHIQYEKPPFATTKNQQGSKSKPAAAPTRATRSSARLNTKPVANNQPSSSNNKPVSNRPTRQTRLRQKEQPPAKPKSCSTTSRTARSSRSTGQVSGGQKVTTNTRTTRNSRTSQASDIEEVKPRRSTRTTRASARAAQKLKDEVKPISTRSRIASKSSSKEVISSSKKEKEEDQKPTTLITENPFLQQATINFERGEPTDMSFLQGPSFAPVDFKFDFTIQSSMFVDASKSPDRRCSSTPLNTAKTGVSKLPTPQGLSAIRPDKTFAKPDAPMNIPVLSLSTSSMSSGHHTTPALPTETYVVLPPKSLEDAPVDMHKEAPSNTHASVASQGSSVGEGNKAQVLDVEMDTEESISDKVEGAQKEFESKVPEVEMKESSTVEKQVIETASIETVSIETEIKLENKLPEVEMKESSAVEKQVIEPASTETEIELENKVPEVEMKETSAIDKKQVEEPVCEVTEVPCEASSGVEMEKSENKDQSKTQEAAPKSDIATAEVVAPKSETSGTLAEDAQQNGGMEEEKDVPYFRRLLVTETTRLTELCDKWQQDMDATSLSEEVLGEVRSTIGKAQLLMSQRFKQFSGLVDDCEFDRGEKKTHCSDLIGFWEMVAYQVEDVDKMFADLDKLKANNWVKEVKVQPKVKKVNKKPKASAASKKATADRIAARQRLMAAKAAMKAKATRSKDSEKVVFEGGFFKVESPVKSPKVHCQAGSPLSAAFLKRTSNTPGSKPGSRQGTPRSQAFIPSKPRLSLQNALCTPISKLVLTEANDAVPSPARVTRSRPGTPHNVVKSVVSGTPTSMSKSCKEVPSTPEVRTPCRGANKHRESVAHPLIPGIASPHMTPNNKIIDAPSLFTPPATTTSSADVNDLICLDSPIAPSVAPPVPIQTDAQDPTGSMRCFAAINASTDGTDVVMSPVRRSARLRHTSGQMVVDNLTDVPEEVDYGYKPNVSLL